MRGERERQANIMLAVTPEAFVPEDHPLRRIKPLVDECLAQLSPRFEEMYAKRGRDPTGAPAQGEPPDRPLLGAQRAPVLRATALQPALQVVPRPERRGRALQRHDLLQEPRASAGGGGGARLLRRGGGRGGPPAAALGRPLQRGRDAPGGVGLAQELPPTGRAGAAVGAGDRRAQHEVDFRGQRRSRETHVSRTDAEARLYRKLRYLGPSSARTAWAS